MGKESIEFIRHIFQETEFLLKHAEKLTLEELENDDILKRAIVRSLEIIGEAAKKIDSETAAKYDEIEWSSMAKMRDKLIHHYFGVDYEIVFDVIRTKIPILHDQIAPLFE